MLKLFYNVMPVQKYFFGNKLSETGTGIRNQGKEFYIFIKNKNEKFSGNPARYSGPDYFMGMLYYKKSEDGIIGNLSGIF